MGDIGRVSRGRGGEKWRGERVRREQLSKEREEQKQ